MLCFVVPHLFVSVLSFGCGGGGCLCCSNGCPGFFPLSPSAEHLCGKRSIGNVSLCIVGGKPHSFWVFFMIAHL